MRLTRALTAAGLLVALAVAPACSPTASDEPKADDPSTAPGSSAPPTSTGPSLDPAFVMDPPGPRAGPIEASDMIVIGKVAFTEDDLAAVTGIAGVRRVVQFSQAQVPIENRLVNIAAVDPATYRNFTLAASADTQEVWDRVAAGELAIDPRLEKKVPADQDGYLRLGSDKDAPQVHIGAFAPQIPQVDAVVNETWIETLKDFGSRPISSQRARMTGIACATSAGVRPSRFRSSA